MLIKRIREATTIYSLKRGIEETEQEFIWRLGEAKTNGTLDLTWEEIAEIINKECRDADDEHRTESAYRKVFTTAKQFYENVFSKMLGGDEYIDELRRQQEQVYKAKRQLYDQRREYNKILTADARNEHLLEELIKAAEKLPEMARVDIANEEEPDEYSEALLFLSDWHVGLEADNIWNKFNPEILQSRVSKLVTDSVRYLKRHKPRVLHVAIIGDMVHGVLHNPGRIASSELGVEQLMKASEIIAEVVNELSMYVENTFVYCTYGNHARSVQNYKDSIHADNLERIIPWWMKQRLKGAKEIKFVDGIYEFLRIRVCGHEVGAVHGDLDNTRNLSSVMCAVFDRAFGIRPKYVAMGHVHHDEANDGNGVKTIIVSSLCGVDEYANNKRMFSTPEQTLLFFNNDGLECRYDITFKE